MNRFLWLPIAVVLCGAGSASYAAAAPTKCSALLHNYDFKDRQIALSDARGVADESATRATVRQLQDLSYQIQKMSLIELMRGENCPLPDRVDGDVNYMQPALDCALAQMKGQADAPECKITDWVPFDKQLPPKQ